MEKVEVGRRIKAEAVWVDWEDKLKFKSVMIDMEKKTMKPQTQESAFKALLDFYIKGGGKSDFSSR